MDLRRIEIPMIKGVYDYDLLSEPSRQYVDLEASKKYLEKQDYNCGDKSHYLASLMDIRITDNSRIGLWSFDFDINWLLSMDYDDPLSKPKPTRYGYFL